MQFFVPARIVPDVNEIVWGDGMNTMGAVIELHYPFADQSATTSLAEDGAPTDDNPRYMDAAQERIDQREEQQRTNSRIQEKGC